MLLIFWSKLSIPDVPDQPLLAGQLDYFLRNIRNWERSYIQQSLREVSDICSTALTMCFGKDTLLLCAAVASTSSEEPSYVAKVGKGARPQLDSLVTAEGQTRDVELSFFTRDLGCCHQNLRPGDESREKEVRQ